MEKEKKLYRSVKDKKLCGVCGGIAEYLGMDSTIVRLVALILVLCFGVSVVPYIICALVMPEEPIVIQHNVLKSDENQRENS